MKAVDRRVKRTPEKERELLEMLREGRTLKEACRQIGVTCHAVYYWRDQDPRFRVDLYEARRAGRDRHVRDMVREVRIPQRGTRR